MEEFDIITKPGAPWCGMPTIEISSREKGELATLVAENAEWARLTIVSVIDHITEPRRVEDYEIKATEHFSTRWELLWNGVNDPILLGEFTKEDGAQRILDYLKASATN